jgi:hypothetical protein
MIPEAAHVLGLFADIRIRHMVVIGWQDAHLYAAPKSSPKDALVIRCAGVGPIVWGIGIPAFVASVCVRLCKQRRGMSRRSRSRSTPCSSRFKAKAGFTSTPHPAGKDVPKGQHRCTSFLPFTKRLDDVPPHQGGFDSEKAPLRCSACGAWRPLLSSVRCGRSGKTDAPQQETVRSRGLCPRCPDLGAAGHRGLPGPVGALAAL